MKAREKRVAILVKETVAEIVASEIRDPNLGFITITGVEIDRNLRKAKIFFTALGEEATRKKTKEVLNKAKGFIRHQLAKKVSLKFIPELEFEIDQLLLQERRVGEILDQLKRDAGNSFSE